MATGACVYATPEVFTIGDDGIAAVIGPADGTDPLLRDVAADPGRRLLQPLPLARGEHHPRAVLREHLRDRRADAPRRACHQRDVAVEINLHASS